MGVFRTLITKGLATALFLLLFAASYLECRAAANPMPLSACCKKGPCPDTRGHSPHSGCQMQATSTEHPGLPEPPLDSSQITMLSESQLPAEGVVPAVQAPALVLFTPDYSPPDLFLQNSSFLI
ncbi:MAG: hypothetical protein WBW33_19295 [Bryobacteraceae bacterium]